MSAYHGEREKEARRLRLEERRGCLAVMLEEERTCLEEELRGLQPDRRSLLAQLVQKTDALRSAREDRRRKVDHFQRDLNQQGAGQQVAVLKPIPDLAGQAIIKAKERS